ncbi:SDR family oxidoreductase [Desulfobulbus oligotrophicus]|uniref:SDR family oxidoreductase n=1 Tax=Desulfobulbus oligotrophicus TaxID=1909699 RepID=A0A7T5VC20_9BACT|nr:SDR family oxidoreductase [Desulfobulbus oligotrophicus]QQG65143.1 SDR family oxidoreductase [Desulfobulbus oligotrophicus]
MGSQKIVLVTGANRGIGFEICRQLAGLGCTVLLGARDIEHGCTAARQLQSKKLDVHAVHVDMNDVTSFSRLHDWIATTHGQLDILVNNAGIANDWAYTAADVPVTLIQETFAVNFFNLIALTQQLLPLLRTAPAGRIVNQSSILASLTLHSTPDSGLENLKPLAYNASKTAVNAFTVHLAHALKDTAIKVNAAHPGDVITDLNPNGLISVVEGARTAVQLAMLPADGPTGGFFHLNDPLPW